MSADTPLARWLRQEMPHRGYPLEGPRAGGISRLADHSGISRASMSRIISGQAEASLEALRGIGKALGYSLAEMMVHAEIATAAEMVGVSRPDPPDVEIPPGVHLRSLPEWERTIWLIPDLTAEERGLAITAVRFRRNPKNTRNMEQLWLRMLPTMVKRLSELLPQDDQPGENGTHKAG